jgi:tetratricopeptide (TPR) repeat protein
MVDFHAPPSVPSPAMQPRLLAFATAALVTLAVPVSATAQRNQPAQGQQQNLLELGRRQYDDLRYEEAIQTLSAAIIRRGNTREQEIQIYELLALSYLALNRNDEAEGAWRLLLQRDPEHQPSSDLAPRIVEFFNGVRQRWEAEGRPGVAREGGPGVPDGAPVQPVTIEHRSPAQQERNRPVSLTANLVDPGNRVARLVLAYRHGNRGLFQRVDTTAAGGGAYTATIPAAAVRPPLVEYYFEAVDANGVPVQARGDAFAPLRIAVPEPGGIPWWVWVGGGVLVAGAAVTIIAVATSSSPARLNITVQGQ